jgi:hypothetical protein
MPEKEARPEKEASQEEHQSKRHRPRGNNAGVTFNKLPRLASKTQKLTQLVTLLGSGQSWTAASLVPSADTAAPELDFRLHEAALSQFSEQARAANSTICATFQAN